ncbi:M48 family metallopeptidase [Methylocapsa acidiphila]|uniref:M48 family metallopeptidase n=1 Tax=Methylocapsa acidiphila TaxID=133552 RepID=UPI00041B433C|nr:M48 family metallopeptidase [Methylocapsa acidiphila]
MDEITAVYFDGKSNAKHRVALSFASALEIREKGIFLAAWAYVDIRRADGPKQVLRLRNIAALPLARLEIADPAAQAEVARLCKLLDVEGAAGEGSTLRIVAWSLAGAVSIWAIAWFGVPFLADRLTPVVPQWAERRLGDAANGQVRAIFSGKACARPEGAAALEKLVDALRRGAGMPQSYAPIVLASNVPNAFALPGGRIYVLNGLLNKATTPDELAGVLAHELGHAAHRDGLRRIIANGGTSYLLGLLFGDVAGASVVLTAGRGLFQAAYSRETESEADLFAVQTMRKLGRSTKPFGELMLRITGPEKDNPFAIFASHPMTEDRLAALGAADAPPQGEPLLSDGEWRALKTICE